VFTYVKPEGDKDDKIILEYYALVPDYVENSIMKRLNISLFSKVPGIVNYFTSQFDSKDSNLLFLS
jgi:hypothetical protein